MAKKTTMKIDKNEAVIKEATEEMQHRQGRILIIDDELQLRQTTKRILEKAGFYCETAYDYQSAKKCVENLQFDVILTDIVLPKMDGIELIERLYEEYHITAGLIFFTGEPTLETSIRATRAGAGEYLEKPVNPETLIAAIRHILAKKSYEITVKSEEGIKSITLTPFFLTPEKISDPLEGRANLIEESDKIHQALIELKKKYGSEFNEDQRNLLNIIAQANLTFKKLIQKKRTT